MSEKKDYFNQRYYEAVIREHGYSDVEFSTVDFALENYDVQSMQRRFLCHHNGNRFAEAVRSGEKAIVTTGFGMSGNPHLGTISQIIKLCDLNRHGMTTQAVMGDLDSYNARNQDLDEARKLSKGFGDYITAMGYEAGKNGSVLRDQYSHPEIVHTAYIISKYITDQDFEDAKEDIAPVYEKAGIYNGWSFPMKQALTLMVADFVHLHLYEGYNHVMVMLGLEEHKYVQLASKVVERMGLDLEIAGIYGRIIKGLSGFPKMSKSLKGSAIDVSTPVEEAKRLLLGEKRSTEDPRENGTFLVMEQVSFLTNSEIEEIEQIYSIGTDSSWQNAVNYYIHTQLERILENWPHRDHLLGRNFLRDSFPQAQP